MTRGPIVKVGGVEYPTIYNKNGVQRFVANPVLCALWESGALDLNRLEIAFQTGRSGLTLRQYAEIMMGLGYSVSGFRDLSTFESMEIENPLWKKNPS